MYINGREVKFKVNKNILISYLDIIDIEMRG